MIAAISPPRGRVSRKAIWVITACLALAGCNEGPTSPKTVDVSGTWQGAYRTGIASNFDLCDTNGPVSATFRQEGSHVEGTLTPQFPSLAQGSFTGELHGDQLLGSLTNNGSSRALGGTASSDRMTLSLDMPFCPSNIIELHR